MTFLVDNMIIRTGCITRVKISNCIKKLKSGKAAGYNNIPPEAIKDGGEMSEEVLLDLCNLIYMEQGAGTGGMEERSANQAAKERRSEPL